MEFAEVTIKESPGLCRCCLSEGCYKDLGSEYTWMNDTEIYADMLLDCFDIGITQHNDGPNGRKRLICEVCITRLRDACNFKRQVVDSERKFIDMLGRGEFRTEAKDTVYASVPVYETPLKAEAIEEVTLTEDYESNVEYLDDMDNTEDDEPVKSEPPPVPVPSTSTSAVAKRGRPKKADSGPPEKKAKLKPKVIKLPKDANPEKKITGNEKRRTLETLFNFTSVMPFKWRYKYICFICGLETESPIYLKEHTKSIHIPYSILDHGSNPAREHEDEIKIDVSETICNVCTKRVPSLEDLTIHLKKHEFDYNDLSILRLRPYRLFDLKCVVCDEIFRPKKSDSYLDRLAILRRNISLVLLYGNVTPFNWNTRGLRCFYCFKLMRDCDILKEHSKKHSSADLESFLRKHIITKDVPVKIDVASIACNYCPDVLILSLDDMISHIVSHGEDYDTSVETCFFPFKLNKVKMKCVLCESEYDNCASLIAHMYKQHIAHSFMCQICGKSFKDHVRLRRHISISHVGYRCTFCDKVFEAAHKLEKHKERWHGQVKLHECNLCSANFKTDYQRIVHLGKEHNVAKYRIKCKHCEKVTNTKGAMALHVQSKHSDLKYKCDLCEYTTGIKWQVKLHQRKHFAVKDYACSICEKAFGRSSNLRTHMKVHVGTTGRVCRHCRRGFADAESLNKHEKEFHDND